MNKKKGIALILTGVLLVLLVSNFSLIRYGVKQASGQLRIMMDTRPVEDLLGDPEFPDSLKQKIRLVREVRDFAVDSLGLEGRKNYQSYYDQQGRELMWVVTACPPYQLEAYEWSFPILGSFSYKGFFDPRMARQEARDLRAKGYDTRIRNAGGWSTLGILKDPILSGMLLRPEGALAELIIHELTHGTIFIRDSLELNENLATFIGQEGARLFLEKQYGRNSRAIREYDRRLHDRSLFTDYVLHGATLLDSLYARYEEDWPESRKREVKQKWMEEFMASIDTVSFQDPVRYRKYFDDFEPNNTFFMSYLRYRGGQAGFQATLRSAYGGDLAAYIRDLKTSYDR